jgi:hypothetical protein
MPILMTGRHVPDWSNYLYLQAHPYAECCRQHFTIHTRYARLGWYHYSDDPRCTSLSLYQSDMQRDTSFIVEDPGPYLIGLPTELKGLVSIPAEVVMIDVDTK